MAKFEEPHSGTLDIFQNQLNKSFLGESGIKIKILVNNKQKKMLIAKKADDTLKHETGNDVYVYVNETIFDALYNANNEFPFIAVDELLASISFSDVAKIETPDITTYKGVLKKYSYDKYEVMIESIKTLFDVEKDKNKK